MTQQVEPTAPRPAPPSSVDPRLATALADLFGIPATELRADAELEADLALDSLSVVELVVALEESYGVRIRHGDRTVVRTVADLQRVVDDAVAAGTPTLPALHLAEDG